MYITSSIVHHDTHINEAVMEEETKNRGALTWLIFDGLVNTVSDKGLDIRARTRIEVSRQLRTSKARNKRNNEHKCT